MAGGRLDSSESLRGRAARGTVVNAGFLVGINLLGFVKGFAVAAFLTVDEYGVWGLIAVSLATLYALVQVGVDDKYIQQDEPDQEAAFQIAFTLQLMLCGAFVLVIGAAMPLFALAFGTSELILPGYAIALAMPAIALQAPLWAFYRRMDFLRQRVLQSFDPVVSLAVTIALAAAGFGYWSLVWGMVCGAWAAAFAAMRASPYPLRLRYRRGTIREYATFSGPLMLSAATGVAVALVPTFVAQHTVGLAGVGVIAIAATISNYARRVEEVVTDTLYPAICAVKERRDLLLESFTKSNRLALLWAVPFGGGIALFAPDLVRFVLGARWEPAILVIQIFGIGAALNQVGFNWSAFYRALGHTRPMAVGAAVMLAGVLAFAVPALIVAGVDGYAVGMGLAVLCYVAVRVAYLARLFGLRPILVNTALGVLPTLPAAAVVLLARLTVGAAERTAGQAAAEAAAFAVLVAAATLFSERALLREVAGYLRRGRAEPAQAPAASGRVAAS